MDGFRKLQRGSSRRISFAAVLLLWLCCIATPAAAAVEIRFHSKDFGVSFPHAFIVLSGTLDESGEPVEANYGFTVRHLIGPSVLFGPVRGTIEEGLGPGYISGSNHHFTLTLTDDEYRLVMSLVEEWRTLPQPSYRLDRRNCVSFVADVARLLGLQADSSGLMRRPKAFLDRVREQNAELIAGRNPVEVVAR